jgi:1-deoxy-D-xylulose-5-phosphate reductoisomerase
MLKPFDWSKHSKLEFYPPDTDRFRCLSLAYHAGRVGGTLPCFMNAANEVLVERFIKGQLSWKAISAKLEALMLGHDSRPAHSVEDILAVDQLARQEATVA